MSICRTGGHEKLRPSALPPESAPHFLGSPEKVAPISLLIWALPRPCLVTSSIRLSTGDHSETSSKPKGGGGRLRPMPGKRYLMAPGPTPVPPEVLAAGARPVLHHRGPDFRALMRRCLERLRLVCRTENDVLLYTASGSAAFESAVVNLLSPGSPVLAVSAGEFGERWVALATAYGADVHELRYAWGETPRAGDVRQRVEETSAEVAFLVHSETSTGVVADVQALAQAAHEAGALVVVDAVSSLGAVQLETDAWGLDVVVAGSQKALMTPPGLSLASVSSWTAPFTPAVSLVASLDAALELLLEEGLEAAFARHAALGRACRAGAKAMGLELFSPDEDRSAVVTAILTPDGIDSSDVVKGLRDRFGMTIANG